MRINAYNIKRKEDILMKRRELVKKFEAGGWELVRHGGRHDIYTDGEHLEEIPRHPDINEVLAKKLIRKWGL